MTNDVRKLPELWELAAAQTVGDDDASEAQRRILSMCADHLKAALASQAAATQQGEALRVLANLARHADDCLSYRQLDTGMGNWHCTCGYDRYVLDGEYAAPVAAAQQGEWTVEGGGMEHWALYAPDGTNMYRFGYDENAGITARGVCRMLNKLAAPVAAKVDFPAIRLTRSPSGLCEVSIEAEPRKWVTVIRDAGCVISHIVEPAGIAAALTAHHGATHE